MSSAIIGLWLFSSLIFQGQSLPLPNPELKIYFQFEEKGVNTLRYHRDGESGYCRRKASYHFSGKQLIQTVTWVDPGNADWCVQDTDMQMGNKSVTPAWISGSHLYLQFQLGEQDILFVWDQMTGSPIVCEKKPPFLAMKYKDLEAWF